MTSTNAVLLCGGEANGDWYADGRTLYIDSKITVGNSDYIVIAWPTGELVGIDVHNQDLV